MFRIIGVGVVQGDKLAEIFDFDDVGFVAAADLDLELLSIGTEDDGFPEMFLSGTGMIDLRKIVA